jgi:predicted DNA-binding antitoxin AbrB/MazE fold protein
MAFVLQERIAIRVGVGQSAWFDTFSIQRSFASPTFPIGMAVCYVSWKHLRSGAIITYTGMSIKVSYKDGVFSPLEKVEGAKPGSIYTVFSDEELRDIRETVGWLKAAESSFDFWNNPADAVYDTL